LKIKILRAPLFPKSQAIHHVGHVGHVELLLKTKALRAWSFPKFYVFDVPYVVDGLWNVLDVVEVLW